MPTLIPAAVGLGSSIFGGIKGNKAAKKQQQQADAQMALIKPLMEAQVAGSKYALDTSKPFLQGASQGIADVQKFWQPLMSGNRTAIDQFLSPERRAINSGYDATAQALSKFGPRGGGRISALAKADTKRQGDLSDLVFGGRTKAADTMRDLAGMQGGLGVSTLGAGLSGGSQAYNLFSGLQNRADGARAGANQAWGDVGSSLGTFLTDLFKPKGA